MEDWILPFNMDFPKGILILSICQWQEVGAGLALNFTETSIKSVWAMPLSTFLVYPWGLIFSSKGIIVVPTSLETSKKHFFPANSEIDKLTLIQSKFLISTESLASLNI